MRLPSQQMCENILRNRRYGGFGKNKVAKKNLLSGNTIDDWFQTKILKAHMKLVGILSTFISVPGATLEW